MNVVIYDQKWGGSNKNIYHVSKVDLNTYQFIFITVCGYDTLNHRRVRNYKVHTCKHFINFLLILTSWFTFQSNSNRGAQTTGNVTTDSTLNRKIAQATRNGRQFERACGRG